MTTTPDASITPAAAASEPEVEVMVRDAVLAGRAMSSGQFIAGLIANAELETVGRPDKLARDMWPNADPVLVQEIWDRALAVGFHAGRTSAAPRLFRDQMARVGDVFERVGFAAMGGLVARSRRLIAPEAGARRGDGGEVRER